MARYALETSPSQMHLVRGANPLKPLIFYIPHGNSPCFGTYHLEIPHKKSILVWYFPMYKMKYIFNKKTTNLFPTTFPHVLASVIWKFPMESPFWYGISPSTHHCSLCPYRLKLNSNKPFIAILVVLWWWTVLYIIT